MGLIEWFERSFFGGGYTGSPEGRREFTKQQLLSLGFGVSAVDRTLREEDRRLEREGKTW